MAILRRHAAADGEMHVDEVSNGRREAEAAANGFASDDRGTVFVGVWRGANDDDPEASAGDAGHRGRAWLDFARGKYPERSTRFRRAVLAEVYRRWPDSKALPVLPSGGLPLAHDLRLTEAGYRIAQDAAASYGLPRSSPLLARE